MHINITDITVKDECTADKGVEYKRVTIKFIPVLEDNWRNKYEENVRIYCE